MKIAEVFSNGRLAGLLTETDSREYIFEYNSEYLLDPTTSAVSLTLPKQTEPYHSSTLFPFFFNLISEGDNKAIQARLLRIDPEDYFELLLASASVDTIGAITIKRA